MNNERKFQRIDVEAPARIELIVSPKRRRIIESYISNLSAVGAFFPALKSLPLGQQVNVDIFLLFEGDDLGGDRHEVITLAVSGIVARSDPSGTAIAFAADYRMNALELCDDRLVMRDLDEGHRAYECFEFMIKPYDYAYASH